MNKKFSTLMASLLLAGGLFGTVNAQNKINLSEAAKTGGYYSLKVDSRTTTTAKDAWHVIVKGDALTLDKVQSGSPESAAALWQAKKTTWNGQEGYTFVNAEGVKLTFNTDGTFNSEGKGTYSVFTISGTRFFPVTVAGKQLTYDENTGALTLAATGMPTDTWTVATKDVTATANNKLGKGFSITIGKQKSKDGKLVWDGAYELEGNVFTGKLTLTKDNRLMNEAGRYIVLTKNTWGTLSNDLQATDAYAGYKFATMTPAALSTDLAKNDNSTVLAYQFRITQPNLVSEEPLEVVAYSSVVELSDDEKATGYELKVATVDGKNYLTTGKADKTPASYLVGDASYTYEMSQGVVVNNTYVKFGDGNDVDYAIFNDALWNISWKNADGKVLVAGPSCSGAWVPAAQVATAYPEGQWLWNGTQFVNRESGNEIPIIGLRKTDKDLVFTGDDGVYTFVKAGEPGHSKAGYLNGTNDDFLKEAFYIGTPVKATDDTVYIAKDAKNALYLTLDKAAAVEFRMSKYTETEDDVTTDLIHHYTTYASSKTKDGLATDTLCLHKYYVSEASTGAELAYDSDNKKFVLSSTSSYDPLVFKNKAEGVYNLVQYLSTSKEYDKNQKLINLKYDETENGYFAFCAASKLYGAHNTAELKQADKAYAYVANDLFIIEKVEAGQHVSGIEGQNIKIMRNADNNYVLYETGSLLETENEVLEGFLGIQNFLDPKYSEKNAAMYVDPAAGMDTWRPEYLLALDWKEVPAGKICPIHGDDPTCPDAHKVETRGYSEGRYLVNLVDSAANRADCKFQNYGTAGDYYRLGFVQAKHIGDTLAIASTGDSLNLTGNDFAKMNVAEFAFHYTDGNRDAFTIETAYSAWIADEVDVLKGKAEKEGELISSTPGWVKFHNGIPVVTKQKSEAEVFVLAQTEENATANEAIEAAGVQVIGGQGVVTVQGAAGKVITVADILGRTIANQVAASDNVTIAAPAGVVVVAVEGEATKVVVK